MSRELLEERRMVSTVWHSSAGDVHSLRGNFYSQRKECTFGKNAGKSFPVFRSRWVWGNYISNYRSVLKRPFFIQKRRWYSWINNIYECLLMMIVSLMYLVRKAAVKKKHVLNWLHTNSLKLVKIRFDWVSLSPKIVLTLDLIATQGINISEVISFYEKYNQAFKHERCICLTLLGGKKGKTILSKTHKYKRWCLKGVQGMKRKAPWVSYSCLVKRWGFNVLPGPGEDPPQEHESKLQLQQQDYTENMWEFCAACRLFIWIISLGRKSGGATTIYPSLKWRIWALL